MRPKPAAKVPNDKAGAAPIDERQRAGAPAAILTSFLTGAKRLRPEAARVAALAPRAAEKTPPPAFGCRLGLTTMAGGAVRSAPLGALTSSAVAAQAGSPGVSQSRASDSAQAIAERRGRIPLF